MRALRCVSTPAADTDAEELAEFYAEQSGEELVTRFFLALERASEFIRQNPETGAPRQTNHPRLQGLRSWPVPGFEDIRLYYLLADASTVRIVRILHGRRDLARIFEEQG